MTAPPSLRLTPGGAAAVLSAILTASPLPLTAITTALTGEELRTRRLTTTTRALTGSEASRIHGLTPAPDPGPGWHSTGQLRLEDGTVAAEVTLLLLVTRTPPGALEELTFTRRPAGSVLAGMTRADRRAIARHPAHDPAGHHAAVSSSAVLMLPRPDLPGTLWAAGIATEEITPAFCQRITR